MTLVSTKVFSENPIHYLNLSKKEDVAIKRGKDIYFITPKSKKYVNTVDPEDPYWDDERNYDDFMRILKERDEGLQPVVATLHSSEDIRNFLGLNEDDV